MFKEIIVEETISLQPWEISKIIRKKCNFIVFDIVSGSGKISDSSHKKEYLIFPENVAKILFKKDEFIFCAEEEGLVIIITYINFDGNLFSAKRNKL